MIAAILLAATTAASPQPAASAQPPTLAALNQLSAGLAGLSGTGARQAPGLSAALGSSGKLVFTRDFGDTTSGTRFPIASITKMFTAVAVMQLVEQQRIDLAATVATYFPDAPYAHEITVRELLQHTSGLWNYGDAVFADGSAAQPTTPRAILALVASHPLDHPPGTGYTYSNSGYVVLGQIVERVTGTTLEAYEREHILEPAGMSQTGWGPPPAGIPFAKGRMGAGGGTPPAFDYSWFYADGDIVSTAADLVRFDNALLDGKLVQPATLARMQTDTVRVDAESRQGLGVQVRDIGGRTWIGHHGGVPGFESDNELVPAAGASMAVLGNAFTFSTAPAMALMRLALFNEASPAEPVAVEDPAITARFRSALSELLAGNIDRNLYSAKVNAGLTPDLLATTAAQLKPLGAIVSTRFVDSRREPGLLVSHYDVTFASGQTLRWVFVIDGDDKIAGIGTS